jgi:hypothetical protein
MPNVNVSVQRSIEVDENHRVAFLYLIKLVGVLVHLGTPRGAQVNLASWKRI